MSKEATRLGDRAVWLFHEYELADELRLSGATVKMTPRALALLRLLVEKGGSVVSKQEIWDTLWPRMIVTDAALTVCVAEIRRVLADDPRNPRFVATVPRRGYRFVAPLKSAPSFHLPMVAAHEELPMVGRAVELEALDRALKDALAGQRRAVFVMGEPGIGKTTLVETYKSRLIKDDGTLVIEAQCSEHFGPSEPYLPLLDGLGQACRGARGKRVLDSLALHAPHWLSQIPVLSANDRASSHGRGEMPATPERMLRELTDAIEMLAADHLVVLCLEDLHWCDQATLDWLSFVTRRRSRVRLLLLMTLRDFAPLEADALLRNRLPDLLLNANAREIKPARLSITAIHEYLGTSPACAPWLAQSPHRERLAELLHGRTEGNPLYLVKVLEAVTTKDSNQVDVDRFSAQLKFGVVPDSLREYLSSQIDRLGADDVRLLEIGSVAGERFSSALVAAALGDGEEEIEQACDAIARRTRMIHQVGVTEGPNQTIASRYAFAHGLYREVLYERIPPGRRARIHRLIGEQLEHIYGTSQDAVASELAMHFGRGLAYEVAAHHCLTAGRNALARAAYDEARGQFEVGLQYAHKVSDASENGAPNIEQELCIALGQTLLVTKGWASAEAEEVFARAQQLAEARNGTSRFLPLWGTAMGAVVRGDFARYAQLGRKLEVHAQTSGDALEIAAAHWALGQGAFHRGDLHGAERAFELALSGFARVGHGAQVSYLGVDYQVFTLCYLSHVQWCLGKVESAVATSKAASALTTDIAHDYSSALALAYAATLNLLLGDVPSANASVEPLLQLCGRKGFTYYLGWGRFVRGWAAAEGTAGTSEEMRDGLAIMRASGARLRLAFYQASLAERYVLEDRKDEAEAAVSSALDELERTRERCWEPEVMRVLAVVSSAASCAGAPTESYLRQALSTARSQDALSWELRVALSLARLLADTGRGVEARDLLVGVYRRCREGFEMPPLREAAELIDSLC